MLNVEQSVTAVKALLDGKSDTAVREACLTALHKWRTKQPNASEFSIHGDLGIELLWLLKPGIDGLDLQTMKEVFVRHGFASWMSGVFEFTTWFTRVGLGIVVRTNDDREHKEGYACPVVIRLTRAGKRLLDSVNDHPLLPGFFDRLQKRCPGIPPDVTELLLDAHECIGHGLVRPSIALIGFAYEQLICVVYEKLLSQSLVGKPQIAINAKMRIGQILAALESAVAVDKEARWRAIVAFNFADGLRGRRNDASHPVQAHAFTDLTEAEEALVSAGRNMPAIWGTRELWPIVPNG